MSAPPGVAQFRAYTLRTDQTWQDLAACVGYDPEMFFDPTRYDLALTVCQSCPVKAPCRELGKGQGEGVWGGRIQRGQPKRSVVLQPCGTPAAYRRHLRNREPLCQPCIEAMSVARKEAL